MPRPDAVAGPGVSAAPACLCPGTVVHVRVAARRHAFRYRVFTVLADIDDLVAANRLCRVFSVDRFNLLSIRQRDFGARDGGSLALFVRRLLADSGAPSPARIRMLAFPRVLGIAFNPLTVYFACDGEGAVKSIVYEVRNTYGGIHHYVHVPEQAAAQGTTVRHRQSKNFFVSPFIDMQQVYHFAVDPPGERFSVRIVERSGDAVTLTARIDGECRLLTTGNVLATLARVPLLPLSVIGGIHAEAMRLLLKGIRLHSIPSDAKTAGISTKEARAVGDNCSSRDRADDLAPRKRGDEF